MNVCETVKKLDDPGTPAMANAAATGGVDPSRSYSWKWLVEKDTSLLSLNNLPAGLKLEDFVVRVDGKRRLTITDRHKPKPSGEAPRFNKTLQFQLPKTANPDAITGCFDGVVLTLTVPSGRKRPQQPAAVTVAAAKEEEVEPKAKTEREKKLIDTAVAAFTLGVLFSHRLFSPAGTNNHI